MGIARRPGLCPASGVLLLWAAACSDADLYSSVGGEPLVPDRVAFSGELCTEDASGDRFPVKVLFIIDSSFDMFSSDPSGQRFDSPAGGIDTVISRNLLQPHVRFGFVGLSLSTTAYPTPDGQHFFEPQAPEIMMALTQMQAPLGNERDLINALNQIENFVFADLAESSPGEVLRSRYLVSMLLAGPPNPSASPLVIAQQAEQLAERIYREGVLEFRINTGLLYFGPSTLDLGTVNYNCYVEDAAGTPCACDASRVGDANFCQAYCALTAPGAPDYDARMATARTAYEAISFATGGRFTEFPCASTINLNVDIASSNIELTRKDIVAFNRNMHVTPDGPVTDSDGDGLADLEELAAFPATSPTLSDSDADGLSDAIEFRMVPRQDPMNGTDRPSSCFDPAIFGVIPDRDIDLLNDCEEGLLQSSASVPDTDGDGLPDLLEFLSGTIPISADDRLLDFDSDGVRNGEEVLTHTDPRSFDGIERGREGYRNNIVNLGVRQVADMADVPALRGLTFLRGAPTLVSGQSFLEWDGCTQTLSWSDSRFPIGTPSYEPVPAPVGVSGEHRAVARAQNGQEIWADFDIVVEFMPTCEDGVVTTHPLITVSDRNCYDVQISNIKLMPTLPADGRTAVGWNEILVFFTQAPTERIDSPGVSKLAKFDVRLICEDYETLTGCRREPAGRFIILTDDLFVTPLP